MSILKLEETEVTNIKGAIRGMRNPMDSWDKSDSYTDADGNFIIGEKDLNLALTLSKAGSTHSKYLRQMFICVDITAPLYWWSEFDTYKIGTVADSCSTMHKLGAYEFSRDMFVFEDTGSDNLVFDRTIDVLLSTLEYARKCYVRCKDNYSKQTAYLRIMKQLLPASWLQKRTVTLNYQVAKSIFQDRDTHRLVEWKEDMCNWIMSLPYSELITIKGGK